MKIDFIYIPILIWILSWFLSWVFSGFRKTSDEIIFANPISFIFSIISGIVGLLSLIYYPVKLIVWIYNNITITF